MNLKQYLLSSFTVLLCCNAEAQDKLIKRNGDEVAGKVVDVATRTITYKKADNPDGPTYTIGKDELAKIVYENGSEDIFNSISDRKARATKKINYGNNIIAFSPLQLSEGVGFGLSYERVLGKKGIISFYLPATVAFASSDMLASSTSPTTSSNKTYLTYYIMPGLKFYPTGSKGVIRYSVGPSIAIVTGKREANILQYDNQNNVIGQYIGPVDRFTLGMMVNNTLNICPTAHLYLGLELGLGASYIDQERGKNTGNLQSLGQFGFKIGYRF